MESGDDELTTVLHGHQSLQEVTLVGVVSSSSTSSTLPASVSSAARGEGGIRGFLDSHYSFSTEDTAMLGTGPTRPYIDSSDIKSSNMSVQTMNPFQDQGGQSFGSVAPMPPKNGMRRQGLWSGGGGGGGSNRNYMSGRNVELEVDGRLQVSDYSAVLDQGQVPMADPFRPSGGGLARYHSAPGSFLANLAADLQQDSAFSSFFADADLPPLNPASDSSMDNMDTEPSSSGLFDDKFLVDTRTFERMGNSQLSPGAGGSVVSQKPVQSVYKHSMEVLHENPIGVEQMSTSTQISSSSQMSSSGLIMPGSMPSSIGLVQPPLSSPQSGQKITMSNLSGNRPGGNASVGPINISSHLASSPKAGQPPMGLNNHLVGSTGAQMGSAINIGNRLSGTVNFPGGLSSEFGGSIPSPGALGGLANAGRSNSLLRQSSSPAGLLAQLTIDVPPPPSLTKAEKQSLSSPLAHSPDDSLSGGTSEENSATHGMMSGIDMGGWEDAASSYMQPWNNDNFSMRKRYRDNMDLGDIIVPGDTSVGGPSLDQGPVPGSLTRHMSLPSSKPKAGGASTDDLLQSVPCRIRAKRGCATHPRSIAERVRRTRISERMRKLQELVPNMDKQQTNTADMLDEAVEYVKQLQRQVQELTESAKKCNGSCHQELKTSV